jgi:nucleotide-binding universal stress UspA family protein
VILAGNPARRLLEYASEEGADLIVMGTHGRTGVARALMGSVAEHVLRTAPCPVLTTKHVRAETAREFAPLYALPSPNFSMR